MKGNLMSLRQKYRRILSGILPAGAAGVSLLLGTMAPSLAADHRAGLQPLTGDRSGVSERLAAIRDAVSEVTGTEGETRRPTDGDLHLAWGNWWNNWGWGRPWGGGGWPN